jgi:hypothetical protein
MCAQASISLPEDDIHFLLSQQGYVTWYKCCKGRGIPLSTSFNFEQVVLVAGAGLV